MARSRTWVLTAAAWCRGPSFAGPWPSTPRLVSRRLFLRRPFSGRSDGAVHVAVPCALSGHVVVSLYNVEDHAPTTPVLLYLPPHAAPDTPDAPHAAADHAPPAFLLRQPFPVVAVHYRWAAGTATAAGAPQWPTPLHDVLFAYDWVRQRLAPDPRGAVGGGRRDLFVYGTHRGAGLAAALALTETQPARAVAVRGVAAYNGVYNWTAFGGDGQHAAGLFAAPADVFAAPADVLDPFASPSLFFRTPRGARGAPPAAFGDPWEEEKVDDDEDTTGVGPRHGRAYLAFPPARSPLAIPAALLLHDGDGDTPPSTARKTKTKNTKNRRAARYPETTTANNSYAAQAAELAALMRRSLGRAAATATADPEQHVQTAAVAVAGTEAAGPRELDVNGQARLLGWLDEQMRARTAAGENAP